MDLPLTQLIQLVKVQGGWGRSPNHYRFQKVFGATAKDRSFLKSVDCYYTYRFPTKLTWLNENEILWK